MSKTHWDGLQTYGVHLENEHTNFRADHWKDGGCCFAFGVNQPTHRGDQLCCILKRKGKACKISADKTKLTITTDEQSTCHTIQEGTCKPPSLNKYPLTNHAVWKTLASYDHTTLKNLLSFLKSERVTLHGILFTNPKRNKVIQWFSWTKKVKNDVEYPVGTIGGLNKIIHLKLPHPPFLLSSDMRHIWDEVQTWEHEGVHGLIVTRINGHEVVGCYEIGKNSFVCTRYPWVSIY
jgi:hypothetical protein